MMPAKESLSPHYEIEAQIGRGGMSVVYSARDLRHRRRVAIKLVRRQSSTSDARALFLQEIIVTANLPHPHIVPLLDSGEVDEGLFFVMPLAESGSLRDRLARARRLPLSEATRIAVQIADALAFAHRRGVIHRDIKPSNILFFAEHAQVSDFGIACVNQPNTDGSPLGSDEFLGRYSNAGSLAYMSPEQSRHDAPVDGRSDVYGLGCTLYEMIGGAPPFTGDTPQALVAQHLVATPVPLDDVRSDVPADFQAVIGRALAKQPEERWPNVTSFATALSLVA